MSERGFRGIRKTRFAAPGRYLGRGRQASGQGCKISLEMLHALSFRRLLD